MADLNINPGGVMPTVNASQYDYGRSFTLTLYDGASTYSIPNGSTVTIEGIKPDRHGFQYEVDSASGSTVVFHTTQQMTAVCGPVMCEIRIKVGDTDIGTANFILMVEESPLNDNTIVSDTELPIIIALATEQMLRAEAAAEAADLSEQHAKTSEDNAALSEQHAASSESAAAADATLAESWAQGGTGTRTGEDTDNSEYWAGRSATDAARAKDEADRAAQYAGFVTPEFVIANNRLYVKTDHTIDFLVANNRLYIKMSA